MLGNRNMEPLPECGVAFLVTMDLKDTMWVEDVVEYRSHAELEGLLAAPAGDGVVGTPGRPIRGVHIASPAVEDGRLYVMTLAVPAARDRRMIVRNALWLFEDPTDAGEDGQSPAWTRWRSKVYSAAFLDVVERRVRAMRPECPRCTSRLTVRVGNGYPGARMMAQAKSGKLRLGSCFGLASPWCCRRCNHRWGPGAERSADEGVSPSVHRSLAQWQYDLTRDQYCPETARCLLIVSRSQAHEFYEDDAPRRDDLFLGVVSALCSPEQCREYVAMRRPPRMKRALLTSLRTDGYHVLELPPKSVKTRAADPEVMRWLDTSLDRLLVRKVISKDTPIVLVRGGTAPGVRSYLVENGYSRVIVSPFTCGEIRGRLRGLLQASGILPV